MTILVTGGAGFIGSNFVRFILEARPHCRVVNLDKLTYAGNLDNLRDVSHRWEGDRYFFVKGDIAHRPLVREIFSGERAPKPDVVVNFAAESHVDRSIIDSTPFIETNIKGTQVLLDAAREFGTELFIHVSTDEVYGSLPLGDGRFKEEDPLLPNSPYSATKAASDLLCRAYYRTYGFPVIVTRCCNNYGPYQFPEKLIPLMILNALEGEPLPVYGDGKNVREWIHVLDHCRALDFLIDHGEPGEIYNIGTGEERSNIDMVRDLIAHVASLTGKPLEELEPLITFVKDRPGHDLRYALNSGKLRKLGWSPGCSLEEGLRETVSWYLENRDWCDRVRSGEYREYYEKWYGDRLEGGS